MTEAIFSNGTDMIVFQDSWCCRCRRESGCRIMDYLVINGKSRRIKGEPPECLSFEDERRPRKPKAKPAAPGQLSIL